MKKYYLIPTWLLVFAAIIAENTETKIILLCLSGVQSIQLLLYAKDAWLLEKVKLVVFSLFSIGFKYNEDGRSIIERQIKDEIRQQNDEMKKAVHHDIYVMYRNADEKCRTIIQEANNTAAAIKYRAEEDVQREIERRASQLVYEPSPDITIPENNPEDFVTVKSEAINRYIEMVSNIDLPIYKECFLSSEKVNERIWAYIESEYEKVYYMSGFEFETYCKNLLQKIGFSNVIVTQKSGDYGADILADKDFVTYAIQCKRYEGNVGNEAIQQIYAAKEYYKKDIAVVITNSSFTDSAKQMAGQMNVRLWDKHILAKFLMLIFLKTIITEQRLLK